MKSKSNWMYSDTKVKLKHIPNPSWHKVMSFIKSSIRITGYILIPVDLATAAIVLIFSEIVGILEELV
jgi:hypothetical protein